MMLGSFEGFFVVVASFLYSSLCLMKRLQLLSLFAGVFLYELNLLV